MKRLIPLLLLVLIAAAGCKGSQWTFSKDWGGGEPAPTQPEPVKPTPTVTPKVETTPDPKPEPAATPKDVIFVLGINGMD